MEPVYATADGVTAASIKTVTVETAEGPRAFDIRKTKASDRHALRKAHVDPDTAEIDLVGANIMAVHLCVVRPELTLEQAGDLDEVVWMQLVAEISEHSEQTVRQLIQPNPEEGSPQATQFPAPEPPAEHQPDSAGAAEPVAAGGVDGSPES